MLYQPRNQPHDILPDPVWHCTHLCTRHPRPSLPQALEQGSVGFRVSYTPHLRPHDMGILVLGSYDITLPPGVIDAHASTVTV
jgi:hypothetical protein